MWLCCFNDLTSVAPVRASINSDVVASWTGLDRFVRYKRQGSGCLDPIASSFSYRLQWLALPVVVLLLALLRSYYLLVLVKGCIAEDGAASSVGALGHLPVIL